MGVGKMIQAKDRIKSELELAKARLICGWYE